MEEEFELKLRKNVDDFEAGFTAGYTDALTWETFDKDTVNPLA